jgi:DNA-binding phage protein
LERGLRLDGGASGRNNPDPDADIPYAWDADDPDTEPAAGVPVVSNLRTDDPTNTTKSTETSEVSREVWDAAVARAERRILRQVVEALEVARVFRRRPVGEIARRARISPRMLCYVRRLKARPSLRTLIALAEAHGVELAIGIRAKTKRPRVEASTAKPLALIDSHEQTERTEVSDVR